LEQLLLEVAGSTLRTVPLAQLVRMQGAVELLGADAYPTFMRLGAAGRLELQPVAAGSLLIEVERATERLGRQPVPTLTFMGEGGAVLGAMYGGHDTTEVAGSDDGQIAVTAEGIRVLLRRFPPPVGFRSEPGVARGWFVCYFSALAFGPDGAWGTRTPAMGGSGAPVAMPGLPPLPPVTRWHQANVAGSPAVAAAVFTTTPAAEVFRDLIHAVTAACQDSLRLKRPLVAQIER